jgi:RNA polymerase sigma-70 factor, ECF subfamily
VAAGTRELALMMTGSGREAEQTPESQEFAQLMKRAKAGDVSAFRQIIVQNQRQVLMTALRLLGRLEQAQDAAQEVFLRLHKYLHRYNETREFSPWLYQVTVNVCRDINRHSRKNSML